MKCDGCEVMMLFLEGPTW